MTGGGSIRAPQALLMCKTSRQQPLHGAGDERQAFVHPKHYDGRSARLDQLKFESGAIRRALGLSGFKSFQCSTTLIRVKNTSQISRLDRRVSVAPTMDYTDKGGPG
jgi:hypothetical protein